MRVCIFTLFCSLSLTVFGQSFPVLPLQIPENTHPISTYDEFGYDVAIDDHTAVVSAPSISASNQSLSGDRPGRVYIYEKQNGTWIDVDTLHPQQDAANNSHFGRSVALKGDLLVVGAYGDELNPLDQSQSTINHGVVYVFERDNAGNWWPSDTLTAVDNQGNDDREGNAHFGFDVATDGTTIIVGAPTKDGASVNEGRVYFFSKQNGSWTLEDELVYEAQSGATFGNTVAISGVYAVVGAPLYDDGNANEGQAYIFKRTMAGWAIDTTFKNDFPDSDNLRYRFGMGLDIDGDKLAITERGNGVAPRVYTYLLKNGQWEFLEYEEFSRDISGGFNDLSVALKGDYMLLGAYDNNYFSQYHAGRVALYEFQNFGNEDWYEIQDFNGAPSAANARFGYSVDIVDYCNYVVGSPFINTSQGGVYFKNQNLSNEDLPIFDRDENYLAYVWSGDGTFNSNCCNVKGALVLEGDEIDQVEQAKAKLLAQPEKFYQIYQGQEFYLDISTLAEFQQVLQFENEFFEYVNYDYYTGFEAVEINLNEEENHGVIYEFEIRTFSSTGQVENRWRILIPFVILGENPIDVRGTTTMPKMPYLIVHDPPGDGSSSSFTQGQKHCRGYGFSFANDSTESSWSSGRLGVKYSTGFNLGPIVQVSTETEIYHETENSFSMGYRETSANEYEQCVETVTSFTTSDLDGVTGSDADVYVGYGTDMVYGLFERVRLGEDCSIEVIRELVFAPVGEPRTFALTEEGINKDIEDLQEFIDDNFTNGANKSQDSLCAIAANQIDVWQKVLDFNQTNKFFALPTNESITFDGGGQSQSVTRKVTTTTAEEFKFEMSIDEETRKESGIYSAGTGGALGSSVAVRTEWGSSSSNSSETTLETAYTLTDDDSGDRFSVDIKRDPTFGTPVFELNEITSETSCPYEGGYQRDQPYLEGVGTDFTAPKIILKDLPLGQPATTTLKVCNNSNEARTYRLKLDDDSNLNPGAIVTVGTTTLGGNEFQEFDGSDDEGIPPGECIEASLFVEQNPLAPSVTEYENIKLFLYPECEQSLRSNFFISAYFGDSYYNCDKDELDLTQTYQNLQVQRASNTIEASNKIEPTANVLYAAGESITLKTGFYAKPGSNFQAIIENCNPPSVTEQPAGLALATPSEELDMQVFPNPMRESATIRFHLPSAQEVQLTARDVSGRVIKNWSQMQAVEGLNETTFYRNDLPQGLYFLTLQTPEQVLTEKIMLTAW